MTGEVLEMEKKPEIAELKEHLIKRCAASFPEHNLRPLK